MTTWQHECLDISSNIIGVGSSVSNSFNPDHTVLVAKLVVTAVTEYHCSWSIIQHFNAVPVNVSMVHEETSRNLLSWKTTGSGPGPQSYGPMFQYEWNIGLVVPVEDEITFIAKQEATANGGILGTCFLTYTSVD